MLTIKEICQLLINMIKIIVKRCTFPQSSVLNPQSLSNSATKTSVNNPIQNRTKIIKAVALISGGLDSMLAAKVIMEQGIHVEGVNFYTGFFGVGTKVVTPRARQDKKDYNTATFVADRLGIKLHVLDITEEFKPIFLNPKHGYGSNLNPCLDCKTFLVKKAKEWAKEKGFDMLITGEVMGQRPMSQR